MLSIRVVYVLSTAEIHSENSHKHDEYSTCVRILYLQAVKRDWQICYRKEVSNKLYIKKVNAPRMSSTSLQDRGST